MASISLFNSNSLLSMIGESRPTPLADTCIRIQGTDRLRTLDLGSAACLGAGKNVRPPLRAGTRTTTIYQSALCCFMHRVSMEDAAEVAPIELAPDNLRLGFHLRLNKLNRIQQVLNSGGIRRRWVRRYGDRSYPSMKQWLPVAHTLQLRTLPQSEPAREPPIIHILPSPDSGPIIFLSMPRALSATHAKGALSPHPLPGRRLAQSLLTPGLPQSAAERPFAAAR